MEARRQRVLAMLAERPGIRYAVVTDTRGDPDVVLLTLAIRGRATCELRIPRDRYDPFLLLDLIDKHGPASINHAARVCARRRRVLYSATPSPTKDPGPRR